MRRSSEYWHMHTYLQRARPIVDGHGGQHQGIQGIDLEAMIRICESLAITSMREKGYHTFKLRTYPGKPHTGNAGHLSTKF